MARLLISAQSLGLGGGNETLTKTLYEFVSKEGVDCTLIYPTNIIPNLFFEEGDKNSKDIRIGTYNPSLLLNFSFYSLLAKSRLDDFAAFHGIGGQNLECMPFYLWNKRYICTVGTTLLEEWRTVFSMTDFSRGGTAYFSGLLNQATLPVLRKLEGRIFRSSEAICTGSTYASGCIQKEFGIKDSDIKIIPPPVDTNHFKPVQSDLDLGRFVLYVGRLCPRKDLKTLINAFYRVQKKEKDLSLVLIGKGPEEKRLKDLAKSLGISSKVLFLGKVDYGSLPEYYSSAELFVLTSKQEGFGIVLAEALACGTPVVSTDCGGPRDIVNDRTGILSKTGDPKSISDDILTIVGDRRFSRRVRTYGPSFVKRNFSSRVYCSRYLELYKELFPDL